LISREEGNSRLLRVVTHEYRDEECQHKNGSEQVEDDEVDGIALRREGFWLRENSSDAHTRPHDVRPPFLRHNLEEDEEGVAEVVKVVVWIGRDSWSEHIPCKR
jgi:hypothetical protein